MRLSDLLCEEAVCTDLKADQRDEAVRELLQALAAAGMIEQTQLEPLVNAVVRREALGTTAIGHGVAVPHARAKDLSRILFALGLSKAGVEFESLDGEPVHAIFLVIGKEDAPEEYVEVLRRISVLIRNDDFRRFLSAARAAREVVELVAEMDG